MDVRLPSAKDPDVLVLQCSDGCFVARGKTVGTLASEFAGTSDYSVAILPADDGEAKEDPYSPRCVVEDLSHVRLQTSS